MKKVKIYLGLCSTGTVSDFQGYVLRAMEKDYAEQIELVYPTNLAHRMFHDYARNGMVEQFLDSDCDILWFLDSDVVPKQHVLDLVTKHLDKWKVAGAPYPIFMSPGMDGEAGREIVFTAYKHDSNGTLKPSMVPDEGIDWVDGLATGCLFIKREVFSEIERPWFKFEYDEFTRALKVGEDIYFCRKMIALGHKFFTDYSMVCKHYKNVELLEMNNYTLTFARRTLENFAEQTRETFREAFKKRQTQPAEHSGLILPASYRA